MSGKEPVQGVGKVSDVRLCERSGATGQISRRTQFFHEVASRQMAFDVLWCVERAARIERDRPFVYDLTGQGYVLSDDQITWFDRRCDVIICNIEAGCHHYGVNVWRAWHPYEVIGHKCGLDAYSFGGANEDAFYGSRTGVSVYPDMHETITGAKLSGSSASYDPEGVHNAWQIEQQA